MTESVAGIVCVAGKVAAIAGTLIRAGHHYYAPGGRDFNRLTLNSRPRANTLARRSAPKIESARNRLSLNCLDAARGHGGTPEIQLQTCFRQGTRFA